MSLRPLELLLPLALLLGACEGRKDQPAASAPPPVAVTVASAVRRTIPVYGEYVGTLQAVNVVEVRARVEGVLTKRAFADGTDVKQGELLFVIDQRPFQAALEQAQAQLAQDEASLAQARAQVARSEASLAFSREQVERYRPLAEREFVTRESFDRYQTQAREGAAAVEATRAAVDQAVATVAADRAAATQARLNLSYTTMTAPIAGRIGRRLTDVGNLVGAGDDTLLASIVQLDPIYVMFSVAERDVPDLLAKRKAGTLSVTVALTAPGAESRAGRVDFIDNAVDPSTGTFKVRAVVPNAERMLLPGQFARVRLLMGRRENAVLVPEQAIVEEQGGQMVLVVGGDKKVVARSVVAGPSFEGLRVIERGLEPGDDVIIDGLQKASPGAMVTPRR